MWPGGKQKAATVWPGLHARPLKLTLLLLLLLSRFSRVLLMVVQQLVAILVLLQEEKSAPLRQTQRSPEGPRHLHRITRLSEAPREVP